MKTVSLQLPTESNPARYGHAGRTRLVNCYATAEGDETKSKLQIHTCYGTSSYVTINAGSKVRGLFSLDENTLLAICGRYLYTVDSAGTVNLVGGIPTDGPVQMVRNRRQDAPQVLIVSDGRAYVYQGGALSEVSDQDYAAALGCTVYNGYGILPAPNGRWQITAIDDFTTFDPLDFAQANYLPDETVAVINLEGGIAIFGERSTEYWVDSGGDDFPFTRTTTREVGCAAGASVTRVDRGVMFIAHDRTVRLMAGYDAQKVSNAGVDRWLEAADLSTVEAFSWQAAGHTFYALSVGGPRDRLDGMSNTFVYDLTTGKWHERESYDYTRWFASCYAFHGGRHIIGDDVGRLHIMSDAYHTESGAPLIVDVQPAPLNSFPSRAIIHRMFADVVPGVGTDASTVPDEIEPQIFLQWSDDGGRNFGGERGKQIGGEGEYRKRVQWHRLGLVRSTGRIWRFRSSAPVVRAMLAASIDVETLAA